MASLILAVTSSAKRSGWTVVIGIPLVELKADMRHKVWSLVFATVCLLGSGLLFAWKMGTTIHRAMHGLIEPALALGANLPVPRCRLGCGKLMRSARRSSRRLRCLQRAQHQATHDALTGLANRMMFHAFLEPQFAAAQRGQAPLSVLYLDLE
jgi:predicted signal transduction protein with EAL and GGDEF domain